METLSIKQQKQLLVSKLDAELEALLFELNNYINCFERTDFFTLSLSKERIKFYKSKYELLRVNIAAPTESAAKAMGKISTLLIEADRNMLDQTAIELKKIFGEYLSFENTLSMFFKASNSAFKESQLSVSQLSDSAKKLSFSINSLRNILK